MRRALRPIGLSLSVSLAACSGHTTIDKLSGPAPTLDPVSTEAYVEKQDRYLRSLYLSTGLAEPPALVSPDWSVVAQAGVSRINIVCSEYLNAIFWWNRRTKRAVKQVNLMGTASSAIMGLYGVRANDIATVATALGLVADSIDNFAGSVLFALEPSGVKTVLAKSQQAYLKASDFRKIETRVEAVNFMQGYLDLCLPATLETNVNRAVKNAPAKVLDPKDGMPKNPDDTQKDPAIAPEVTFESTGT